MSAAPETCRQGIAARLVPGSLRGRLTLLLTFGILLASLLSLFVAEQGRHRYFALLRLDNVAAGAADLSQRYARDPQGTEAMLRATQIFGVGQAPPELRIQHEDRDLEERLASRLGPASHPAAAELPTSACFPHAKAHIRVAGLDNPAFPDCWLVRFTDPHGQERRLLLYQPKLPPKQGSPSEDPLYIAVTLLASVALATLVSRLATRPLRLLTHAARAFSLSIDPEPMAETGPQEVRSALATFNLMQTRIRAGFTERTHVLASIAHDLQTPLTRLRLRLEEVEDETLRARLVADLSATQKMVRAGLDLARSGEMREAWSMVDVDSIVASVAADAAEFGAAVQCVAQSGRQLRTKPNALIRCLTNLIENALKYGGDAWVRCERLGDELVISVRDHGPGLPPAHLTAVFEPFRRYPVPGGEGAGGSGLGLTITRELARSFGGRVDLANHAEGGLVARILLPIP